MLSLDKQICCLILHQYKDANRNQMRKWDFLSSYSKLTKKILALVIALYVDGR